ncbi:hypothetical protein CKM354_001137300 [Cercospora kikuchii]|nr:uncharacterized protein CKM354_001137300 [Cercospora kikuchii]GIZ48306.1 hypothetical protein CKM354_001137300 [Cercospora kikuchii]
MGTGIVSILLHNLPYNGIWLYWISIIIFCLNILLFSLFLTISVVRYVLWPEIWKKMIGHPAQSLFLGTFPMGFATIINMVVFVCAPRWGEWVAYLAWAMWIFDAAISISICFYVPFAIMHLHKGTQLQTMTAAWLLPIVSTIVAAATGAIVAEVLPNPQYALWTMVASYILWGTGVPLAMSVLVIYFHRLAVHKIPPPEVIVSCCLPLGPLGQGAFGIMQLGKVAKKVMPVTTTLEVEIAGDILYTLGWGLALVMWGYALVWMFFAVSSIVRSKLPFNMGWWGFTFPLGVFTTATTTFGKEMPSRFFNVLGTIFSLVVTLLWLCVALLTLRSAVSKELFVAPCLNEPSTKRAATVQDLEGAGKDGASGLALEKQ